MILDELPETHKLFTELARLRTRGFLLDSILRYYNTKTKQFEIPEEYEHEIIKQLNNDKPKDVLYKKIKQELHSEEFQRLIEQSK